MTIGVDLRRPLRSPSSGTMQPFAAMIAFTAFGHFSMSSTILSLVGVCSHVRVIADHSSFGVPIENFRSSSGGRWPVQTTWSTTPFFKSLKRCVSSGHSSGELPVRLPSYRVP
eukprot:5256167-Prymnesium_polylepis.1